ncbi:MAG: multidrug resistance efflux transporter family protein, partial [Thermomonas sp.]
WIALAMWAAVETGLPSAGQVWLAAGVALSAGVIATILFFQATGIVRDNPVALGAAEAMQAAEVLFAVLLGALFLGEAWPRGLALVGAGVVILGIGLFAWVVAHDLRDARQVRALRTDRGS